MSFSKVHSAQVSFLKAHVVDIEVDLSKGLHAFSIVGLPDKAVEEARDRISAAIKNSDFKSPKQRNQKITISLAPAEIKKEGSNFDLAMALGFLLAAGDIRFDPKHRLFLGELSLDGTLRPVRGTLPLAEEARRKGFREIFVPRECAEEAALIEGVTVYPAESLRAVINHLEERPLRDGARSVLTPQPKTVIAKTIRVPEIDLDDIRGQENAKRGLLIAAAGGHNIAMWGPPGTGKSMLAKALIAILPPLPFNHALEVTGIHSIAGTLDGAVIDSPPFRSPHHTASHVAIVGGGASVRPGEITLAHRGILFLDEFPEFDRRVLESLREPMEDGVISVSRAKGSARFPARFILAAAMNPCPCGNFGVSGKDCVCPAHAVERYRRKMSGPIVDRIDLWLEVFSIPHEKLSEKRGTSGETDTTRQNVIRARDIQQRRAEREKRTRVLNSELSVRDLENISIDNAARETLNVSAKRLDLSPRSYHKVLKLSRTIADLEESDDIKTVHILEALQYRPKKLTV